SRRRHTRSYGDWSSDVCSSDLQIPELLLVAGLIAALQQMGGERPQVVVHDGVRVRVGPRPLDRQGVVVRRIDARDLPRFVAALEIGRASCRERVSLSVVAGVWI